MKFASLWINKDSDNHTLPKVIEICLRSLIRYNNELTLYTYDKNLIVPGGIIVKDANEILEIDSLMTSIDYDKQCCSFANFSDRFRWKLLSEHPEYCWIDTDIYLIKEIPEMEKIITKPEIGVIKYNNSEFFKMLYDFATDPCSIIFPFDEEERVKYKNKIKKEETDLAYRRLRFEWGYAGVNLFCKLIDYYNIEANDSELFYPVNFWDYHDIFIKSYDSHLTLTDIFPKSYGIHLWNGLIKKHNPGVYYYIDSIYYKIIKEDEICNALDK